MEAGVEVINGYILPDPTLNSRRNPQDQETVETVLKAPYRTKRCTNPVGQQP